MFGLNSFKVRRFGYKLHCLLIARKAWVVTRTGIYEVRVYKRDGDNRLQCHGGIGFTYKGWQNVGRYDTYYTYQKAQRRFDLETIDRLNNENAKMHEILRYKNIHYWGNPNGKH